MRRKVQSKLSVGPYGVTWKLTAAMNFALRLDLQSEV